MLTVSPFEAALATDASEISELMRNRNSALVLAEFSFIFLLTSSIC